MSEHGDVILRFDEVNFGYTEKKLLMEEASFSVRENMKLTLMGQNGAGKSTIFKMITGDLEPLKGKIHIKNGTTIGISKQVMDRKYAEMSVYQYFETAFVDVPRNLPKLIDDVLEVVNYQVPLDMVVKNLSGGQQARLLLAHALISKPDILLLDEPTNNLDDEGIGHLISFLMMYEKTVMVISHDADFLNTFTDGVVYLDAMTKEIDQYVGDYYDVSEKIAKRVEAEQRKNAQLKKEIQEKKDKVNFFAHKGGKMRKLASKLRDDIESAEASKVFVKEDDKTISSFIIPALEYTKPVVTISSVGIWVNHEQVQKKVNIELRRRSRLIVKGPNGIGKTTLLERLANRQEAGAVIPADVTVGYYRQDFSGLDFSQKAFDSLLEVMESGNNETVYAIAAKFLLRGDVLSQEIGMLSEGQKALLSFARFVLQKPNLLILDEPTNHVNFRHLPVIAKALDVYDGAMIMVSHDAEFVKQIKFDDELDLGRLRDRE
ncbi:hypothetical protein COY25_03810 [Candidatus Uhrbacteria bacterium CG_4_10_14_0_2_um_filter_41_7]|uniref:ABC transporter domain-containing protein n=1 Tax=Candidatus Uhrbacteria bacterium CG_4_9_14_3_um_filter_41_35 TaxID=1975034 RepID=A0A2M7XF18_9BACT|nr:MAG: hypothetical protein COV92_03255 [Candidatus Uhrbacteria bacterium CG11_big_fil_rev_8_21_14_0_20_41_9]PIZ53217.1 MAG: hypothetical protein COY25_03810 [Candidatus Uhrbacteria bacterium CG_4_10_14_0_2_um_filter_41_7]PJA46452.1 MAG: hypothetical protein CO173_01660 [Candidatus Uhrbacteria bacterium CG_4_9_14_3_um_filter_41_35]